MVKHDLFVPLMFVIEVSIMVVVMLVHLVMLVQTSL